MTVTQRHPCQAIPRPAHVGAHVPHSQSGMTSAALEARARVDWALNVMPMIGMPMRWQ